MQARVPLGGWMDGFRYANKPNTIHPWGSICKVANIPHWGCARLEARAAVHLPGLLDDLGVARHHGLPRRESHGKARLRPHKGIPRHHRLPCHSFFELFGLSHYRSVSLSLTLSECSRADIPPMHLFSRPPPPPLPITLSYLGVAVSAAVGTETGQEHARE